MVKKVVLTQVCPIILMLCMIFLTGCSKQKEDSLVTESVVMPAIENITWESTYEALDSLGEPASITPIDDESIIINKGYYVTAEYDGLTLTLSAKDDFTIVPESSVIAVTSLSDVYIDSNGVKVGMSKEELMQKYSIRENEFLSGEENGEIYRIHNNFITHNIPAYDSFYVADNGDNPVVLIYLIKDDCINGILLRHLTAD